MTVNADRSTVLRRRLALLLLHLLQVKLELLALENVPVATSALPRAGRDRGIQAAAKDIHATMASIMEEQTICVRQQKRGGNLSLSLSEGSTLGEHVGCTATTLIVSRQNVPCGELIRKVGVDLVVLAPELQLPGDVVALGVSLLLLLALLLRRRP